MVIAKQNSNWKKTLQLLSTKIDNHTFESFFEDLTLSSMDDNQATLIVPSPLAKQFFSLKSDTSSMLLNAINQVFNSHLKKISFLTNEESNALKKSAETNVRPRENSNVKTTFFSNCKINKNYTFDNFVVGECNREAVRASLLVANNPATAYNPLFIYSKSGLGKTHLLHAIANYYLEKHPKANVLYITTDAFIDEFVKYCKGNQEDISMREFFQDVDLLLVDDIQFLSDKTKTAEMFFYIFSSLINNGRQIVLTSDRQPSDLRGLEERLVSRFYMGLTVKMNTPTTDTLIEILNRKIIYRGLDINLFDQDGLAFMAEKFSHNVRELEGALNRLLFALSSNENKYISLDDVKDTFSFLKGIQDSKKKVNEDDIISVVGEYYHFDNESIKSKDRRAQVAIARRVSMYLCRAMLSSSFTEIGKIFKRDHSTVITAVKKVEKEIKINNEMLNAVNDLKKRIKAL